MGEWISVDSRLPDDGVCVDVWAEIVGGYDNGDAGRFENVFYCHENSGWFIFINRNKSCDDNPDDVYIESVKHWFKGSLLVTHWMHQPEPPKPAKSAEEFNQWLKEL